MMEIVEMYLLEERDSFINFLISNKFEKLQWLPIALEKGASQPHLHSKTSGRTKRQRRIAIRVSSGALGDVYGELQDDFSPASVGMARRDLRKQCLQTHPPTI
jgi:hypothetical protein